MQRLRLERRPSVNNVTVKFCWAVAQYTAGAQKQETADAHCQAPAVLSVALPGDRALSGAALAEVHFHFGQHGPVQGLAALLRLHIWCFRGAHQSQRAEEGLSLVLATLAQPRMRADRHQSYAVKKDSAKQLLHREAPVYNRRSPSTPSAF